ncbi:MAG: polyprenyl synthetase family protein [Planctomycetaceae bacterium]|jgi:geranylgeranyl diphosphate synthase type II|nr:polyprenyl synthetase family protein [Planctomycetaceae bacterium]
MVSRYIDDLRGFINTALDEATQFDVNCPVRLREAIRYSLLASGKRLRPILVLTACELCGGNSQKAISAACAVEMIHAYSLIHDDLPAMDNDDLRRGLPTCHKKFDESTAILAGDALLALAFEMLGNLTPLELAGRCCKELAVAAGPCQLVGGQMDDIYRNDFPESGNIQIIEHIHRRKTGALIRTSLRLGSFVAGASEEQQIALNEFGTHFGLAFQITDDLLDVLGNEQTVGKRLRKDTENDKWSYPRFLGVDGARREAEQTLKLAEHSLEFFRNDNIIRNNNLAQNDNLALETLYSMVKHLAKREK